jgi:hypothetical protein
MARSAVIRLDPEQLSDWAERLGHEDTRRSPGAMR